MIVSRKHPKLNEAAQVYEHLRKIMARQDKFEQDKEHFYVIILDARNRKGDLFGRQRVDEIVTRCATETARNLVDTLFTAVTEYAAGMETFDDQTVVVIKVKDGAGTSK